MIEKNYTRYKTDDLLRLFGMIERTTRKMNRTNGNFMRLLRSRTATGWTLEESDQAEIKKVKIFVPSPESIYQLYPAEALTTPDRIPLDALLLNFALPLTAEVLRTTVSWLERNGQASPLLREAIQAENIELHVLPAKVEKPPPSRKLNEAEKRQRLRELYGSGGELAHPGSGRGASWQYEFQSTRRRYEAELARRMNHRSKLLEIGESVPLYETWPEFLRRLADEHEHEHES